jgi:hypothetical protein
MSGSLPYAKERHNRVMSTDYGKYMQSSERKTQELIRQTSNPDRQMYTDKVKKEQKSVGNETRRLEELLLNKRETLESQQAKLRAQEELISLHEKRNTLLSDRNKKLEEMINQAESLIMTLDHGFTHLISHSNLYSEFPPNVKPISQDRIREILDRKNMHQESLQDLRNFYQITLKQIEEINKKIKGERHDEGIQGIDTLHDSLEESINS